MSLVPRALRAEERKSCHLGGGLLLSLAAEAVQFASHLKRCMFRGLHEAVSHDLVATSVSVVATIYRSPV